MQNEIITDEEIKESSERGDELFSELIEQIEQGDEDPAGVAYSLWINLSRYLAEMGWTGPELARDAQHHVADQTSDGTA
jgi:hypothetical protein